MTLQEFMQQDDLDGSDILAYSSLNANSNEEDDSAFKSGGAIMAALEQQNPKFKNVPTIKQKMV